MSDYLAEAKALQDEMVNDRRWLHRHAEVGEHLPETAAYVKKKLAGMGIEAKEICECGLVVNLGGKKPGKCILLRADMDALPMQEQSGVSFACENGCAHSCGHDMHTAMLLGAAKILKAHEDELCETVKLMFQPAEEIFTGAAKMMKAGVAEDPHVDAAVTLHVSSVSPFPVNSLVLKKGLGNASCDVYRVVVKGLGCHGANPDQGVDPITAAAHIHTAFQELSAREINSQDVAVITQGMFHSGEAPNVIPGTAVMEGTMRALKEEVRQKLLRRMREITESIGKAFRAEATFEVCGGCRPLYNDEAVFEAARTYFTELVGEEGVKIKGSEAAMGAEDFSNVLENIPGIQVVLAVGSTLDGAKYPMHNPRVVFREEPMYIGAGGMAYLAKRWLEDHNG